MPIVRKARRPVHGPVSSHLVVGKVPAQAARMAAACITFNSTCTSKSERSSNMQKKKRKLKRPQLKRPLRKLPRHPPRRRKQSPRNQRAAGKISSPFPTRGRGFLYLSLLQNQSKLWLTNS